MQRASNREMICGLMRLHPCMSIVSEAGGSSACILVEVWRDARDVCIDYAYLKPV